MGLLTELGNLKFEGRQRREENYQTPSSATARGSRDTRAEAKEGSMKTDIYSVKCFECGTVIAEVAGARSQVRAHLKAQGWDVAIPYFAVVPAGEAREAKRTHARQTVDICPPCQQTRINRACLALQKYYEEGRHETHTKI